MLRRVCAAKRMTKGGISRERRMKKADDDEGGGRGEVRGGWQRDRGEGKEARGGASEIEGVLDGQDAPACWFIPYNLLSHLIRLLVRGVGQRFAPMARRGQQRGAACY